MATFFRCDRCKTERDKVYPSIKIQEVMPEIEDTFRDNYRDNRRVSNRTIDLCTPCRVLLEEILKGYMEVTKK